MLELIVGTYGALCWLLFKKLKIIPVTTYTVSGAVLGGIFLAAFLLISLSVCHPVSADGRLYAPMTQIVPPVRGQVTEVAVTADTPLKQGDVLFRVDPRPYQYEVTRLEASLAVKQQKLAQLNEQLTAAESATRDARNELAVAESQFDRQAREAVDSAVAQVRQVQQRLDLAEKNLKRLAELRKSGASSELQVDRAQTEVTNLGQELRQAKAAETVAREKLESGGSSVKSARERIAQAEAAERQTRIAVKTDSDGITPEIRETMALLDKARYDLEQTTVRAPTDGSVPQVVLRPGQMVVPLPIAPVMVYMNQEQPYLIASFEQKAISGVHPGLEAEAIFKAYPGQVYKVKVKRILSAMREGELDPAGKLLTPTPASSEGHIPVVFEYGDDVAALNLPVGSAASIAIYTEKLHALSIVRKIILRMKSWENYVSLH